MLRSFSSRLGIQSWCFRSLTSHRAVIQALRECDVRGLEMCDVHLNPVDYDDSGAGQLREYSDAGITITAYGVHRFDANEVRARKVFEFARLAGFSTITADLAPGGLEVVEKLCVEYDKKIAIHNHGRKHALGSVQALTALFSRSSPQIGLCLDTGWMMDSGDDPIEVAKLFSNRLYGLHIKDFVFDRAGRPHDTVTGSGNLDLRGLAPVLQDIRFDGPLTLEYEGDADQPVPALKQCVAVIRRFL